MAEIIVIPPSKTVDRTIKKLRTAAYARVSSDSEDQLNSFLTQMDYYKQYISENPEMEFIDLYADEAVTGTSKDKREGFLRMIADCKEGKIDLILTKSVSRFARNTYDCISTVRELKSIGVNVVFEENEIDTRKITTESELIAIASIAQEESVSTSNNVKMAVRSRMKNGTFKQGSAPYGYSVHNGVFTIVPEQAEIVQLIFRAYKEGKSLIKIAKELTDMQIQKADGSSKWVPNHIKYILRNIRYKGDALHQKFYTTEFPFKYKINRGELDMYYMKNANPPIVSEGLFDKVNALLAEKSVRFNSTHGKITEDCPLRLKIYCAECGSAYRLKSSKTKHWLCRNRDIGLRRCTNPQIAEDKVYRAFVKIYNRLVKNKEIILVKMLNELKLLKERKISGKHEIYDISEEIAKLTKQVLVINKLQAQGYIESASYYEKLNEINAKISELTKEKKSLMGRDACDEAIKTTTALITVIDKKGAIDKFDNSVFGATVEKIIAQSSMLTFVMINGMKITVDAEV